MQLNKTKEKHSKDSIDNRETKGGKVLEDNRVGTTQMKNETGLPDNLKTGIESLSGISMDDVNVHYDSSQPAKLNAHAYAQGTDIHLGSGQEKHLPHEAWHVVQQKQGRVKPTMQLKDKVSINDDVGLEKEADAMGDEALRTTNPSPNPQQSKSAASEFPIQRKIRFQFGQSQGLLTESTTVGDYAEFYHQFDNRFPQFSNDPIIRSTLISYAAAPETFDLNELAAKFVKEGASFYSSRRPTRRIQDDPEKRKGLITGRDGDERLQKWLAEPVTAKESSGARTHQKLLGNFMEDMDANSRRDRHLKGEVLPMAVTAFQYLSHNSSHLPNADSGAVQKPESLRPLFYFRSQSQNMMVHEAFYNKLSNRAQRKPPTDDIDSLPEREAITGALGKLGGPERAGLGARKNNVEIYAETLHQAFRSGNPYIMHQFMMEQYGVSGMLAPQKQAPQGLVHDELMGLSKNRLIKSQKTQGGEVVLENLRMRRRAVSDIAERAGKLGLSHLIPFNVEGNPSIHVVVRPAKINPKLPVEGIVNTVISFFSGLLNFYALKAGLPVFVLRRQSFGFLRPTITDTENSFRLSMGLQPAEYAEVVLRALKVMDHAISSIPKNLMDFILTIQSQKGGQRGPLPINDKLWNYLGNYMQSENYQMLAYRLSEQVFAKQGVAGFTHLILYIIRHNVLDKMVESKKVKQETQGDYDQASLDDDAAGQNLQSNQSPGELKIPYDNTPGSKFQKTLDAYKTANTKKRETAGRLRELERRRSHPDEVVAAMDRNINDYGIRGLIMGEDAGIKDDPLHHKDFKFNPSSDFGVRKILASVLGLAESTIAEFAELEDFRPYLPKSWNFAASKLINHVKKARMLLSVKGQINDLQPNAHIYSKSVLVIEGLLESLILFRSFSKLGSHGSPKETVEEKMQKRLSGMFSKLGVKVSVFRTDSGEQAGALSVLAFSNATKKIESREAQKNRTVVVDDAYFEMPNMIKTLVDKKRIESTRKVSGKPQMEEDGEHTMYLADIHPGTAEKSKAGIHPTANRFGEILQSAGRLKAQYIVVDITNAEVFEPKVEKGITFWAVELAPILKPGARLVLFSSLIKHNELGLDKYQAGRMVVFTFNGSAMSSSSSAQPADVFEDTIKIITKDVHNPIIDDFLNMMHELPVA